MVRIALFMASARAQPILHAMSNPEQSKSAIDNTETRVVQSRTALYQEFTDLVNSDEVPDKCCVDMVSFNGIFVNCTSRVGAPLTMLEVCQSMRDMKRDMSIAMSRFLGSGKNANGNDDMERDIEFYDNYVKGNALHFAVYLAWNHGREIPAWNSTLVPVECQLDIGVSGASHEVPEVGRKRAYASSPAPFEPSKLEKLIEMQSKFFEYALGGNVSRSLSSSSAALTTDVHTLDAEIALCQRLRSDKTLTSEQRQKVDAKYDALIEQALLQPNGASFIRQ